MDLSVWSHYYIKKGYNNNTFRTISGGLYMVIGFVGLGIMGNRWQRIFAELDTH